MVRWHSCGSMVASSGGQSGGHGWLGFGWRKEEKGVAAVVGNGAKERLMWVLYRGGAHI